ncbi:MAG: HAD-IA family hydrolase, partial [Clostridia bacterium]|nr:HAD-IA family hydrolase [Clostridia bacterium]
MKNAKYACVMFDLDGTLLDTIEDITNAVNITLCEFGYPKRSVSEVKTYINNGARRLIFLALPENARSDENVSAVLERYLEVYAEHVCEKTRPYDKIPELVKKLKDGGIKLAVVSNKPEKLVGALLEICFGKCVFDYFSGTGENLPRKPDKACIRRALDYLKVPPDSVLYVGDSSVDVMTARNSELKCVGVTWGFGGKHSFDGYSPDITADSAKEL